MQNDEFDTEIIDKEVVLELLKFPTFFLLYINEDIKKH